MTTSATLPRLTADHYLGTLINLALYGDEIPVYITPEKPIHPLLKHGMDATRLYLVLYQVRMIEAAHRARLEANPILRTLLGEIDKLVETIES
jgi:hypothetical protein